MNCKRLYIQPHFLSQKKKCSTSIFPWHEQAKALNNTIIIKLKWKKVYGKNIKPVNVDQ